MIAGLPGAERASALCNPIRRRKRWTLRPTPAWHPKCDEVLANPIWHALCGLQQSLGVQADEGRERRYHAEVSPFSAVDRLDQAVCTHPSAQRLRDRCTSPAARDLRPALVGERAVSSRRGSVRWPRARNAEAWVLRDIHLEDNAICEGIQRGVQSRI